MIVTLSTMATQSVPPIDEPPPPYVGPNAPKNPDGTDAFGSNTEPLPYPMTSPGTSTTVTYQQQPHPTATVVVRNTQTTVIFGTKPVRMRCPYCRR